MMTSRPLSYGNLYAAHSPYFDLTPLAATGPLHCLEVEVAWRRFKGEFRSRPGPLMGMTHRYRALLVEAYADPRYIASEPGALNEDLRSSRWTEMCEALAKPCSLSSEQLTGLCRLLNSLGYHRQTKELLVTLRNDDRITPEHHIVLALATMHIGEPGNIGCSMLQEVFEKPCASPGERLKAANALTLIYSEVIRDQSAADNWLRVAETASIGVLERLSSTDRVRMQGYQCIVAMRAHHYQACEKTVTIAEHCLDKLMSAWGTEGLENDLRAEAVRRLSDENSRYWMLRGDLHRALRYYNLSVSIDPIDPKARWLRADAYLAAGHLEEAREDYLAAARLGPIANGRSWFFAGHCAEALGDLPDAAANYELSSICDTRSTTALDALAHLMQRTGGQPTRARV